MHSHLLTFEIHQKDKLICIHGDSSGLRHLAQKLLVLAEQSESGNHDHDHLMAENWGGDDLSSEAQSDESELVNHVKIYGWSLNITDSESSG